MGTKRYIGIDHGGMLFFSSKGKAGGNLDHGVMEVTSDGGNLTVKHRTYHQVFPYEGRCRFKAADHKATGIMATFLPEGSIVEAEYDSRPDFVHLVLRTTDSIHHATAKKLSRLVAAKMGKDWVGASFTSDLKMVLDDRFDGICHWCHVVSIMKSP